MNQPQSSGSLRFFRSLQGRLIAGNLIGLPLLLALAGFAVENAFKESQLSSESATLRSTFYLLLEAAEWQSGSLTLPDNLAEPRFSLIDSGLYATVTAADDPVRNNSNQWASGNLTPPLWQSISARLSELVLTPPSLTFTPGQEQISNIALAGSPYFLFVYDLVWELDNQEEASLRFAIYHSAEEFNKELRRFRVTLRSGLGILAIGVLVIQWTIMHWGLRPLARLKTEIDAVNAADQFSIQGVYPAEITPVTNSLNRVLSTEKSQRDRYHQTLSNLAHSIKTPLAVIKGELHKQVPGNNDNTQIVSEQIEEIDHIIRRQLQRSVIQTDTHIYQSVPLRPVVERLCSALEKVYKNKPMEFQVDIPQQLTLRMDQQDIFEVLGNLVENACKYGEGKVRITGQPLAGGVQLVIEDNGPGVSKSNAASMLKRGARGDTRSTGQGLGLAIANDIISAYQGNIKIDASPDLGGAKLTLSFSG